jgi:hypothetical protein
VSHEVLSIPRKNQDPFEGLIMCHGAMAGNTLPSRWLDNAGSIRRRLFVINFSVQVQKTKANLLTQLKTVELPAIIRKIVYCYRVATVLVKDRDIWSSGLLSQHIIDQNDDLYAATNPLRKFIKEGCQLGPKLDDVNPFIWCPLSEFTTALKVYNTRNNLTQSPWSEDYYSAVFADSKLSVREARFVWGDDNPRMAPIVVGGCPTDMLGRVVNEDTSDPNNITRTYKALPQLTDDNDRERPDLFRVTQQQLNAVDMNTTLFN